MTAPRAYEDDRLRDLADVQETIKARRFDETFADELDASVRGEYRRLWQGAAAGARAG